MKICSKKVYTRTETWRMENTARYKKPRRTAKEKVNKDGENQDRDNEWMTKEYSNIEKTMTKKHRKMNKTKNTNDKLS